MLRFDSNEIGWICCYLLRILFLLLFRLVFIRQWLWDIIRVDGRLFLPLRPYLFYPPSPLPNPSIHLFELILIFHLHGLCMVFSILVCMCAQSNIVALFVCVCRFHIINIKIGTQTDVSKIRSTGNKEQSSQNKLLLRKRDADLFFFLSSLSYSFFAEEKGGRSKKWTWNIVSNNFRDFPRRWNDIFFSTIDKFRVCVCAFDMI